MFDISREFELAKNNLLSKLPQYLTNKGINISLPFTCLNPNDEAHLTSMKYDPLDNKVKCSECGSQYDIFDLIGIDFELNSFSRQFIKAHELFIGKVPLGYIDILKNYSSENSSTNQNTPIKNPIFEIANDVSVNDTTETAKTLQFEFEKNKVDNSVTPIQSSNRIFNSISPFDEAKMHSINVQQNMVPSNSTTPAFGDTFSQNQPNVSSNNTIKTNTFANHSTLQFGDTSNSSQPKFGGDNNLTFSSMHNEANLNFAEAINRFALNADATSYFKDRGISDAIVKKFKLGFDENFKAEISNGSTLNKNWEAVIIPYGVKGYCARNTDPNATSKDRYKKIGSFDIYNVEALDKEGDIFICEGEFDALSVETLGFNAIALGGAGNIRLLIERIKNCNIKHHYYVCLDNDDAGREATNQIANYLYQLNVSFKCVNISYPYKDINEALCSDLDMIRDRFNNLEEILSFKFKTIEKEALPFKYICTPEDLNALDLSPDLYTISAKPNVLRWLTTHIIQNKFSSIIYVANNGQCSILEKHIAMNVGNGFDKNNWNHLKFLPSDDESYVDNILKGVEAQIMLSNTNFVTIVDVSAFTCENAISLLKELSSALEKLNLPILALCNQKDSAYFEAIAAQNVDVSINEDGDFVCKTLGPKGLPISFIKKNNRI